MATTHHDDTKQALAEAIRTRANGTSDAALVIGTSSLALPSTGVLCIIPLDNFAAASSVGVTTSPSNANEAAATGAGEAAIGIVVHENPPVNAASEVFRGAVGVGSGEIQISSTSIAINDVIRLTSDVTWTAPT